MYCGYLAFALCSAFVSVGCVCCVCAFASAHSEAMRCSHFHRFSSIVSVVAFDRFVFFCARALLGVSKNYGLNE